MKTQHTPGPWRWEHNSASNHRNACIEITSENGHKGDIAYLQSSEHVGGPTKAETQSNARLVSAAPDLLKALSETALELDACQKVIHYAGGFDPAYVNGAQDALKKARAAIAKATGEQP